MLVRNIQMLVTCCSVAVALRYAAPVAAAPGPDEEAPILSGTWSYTAITPLQRPLELGDQREYSHSELSAIENARWLNEAGDARARVAIIAGEARTSLVIAPPDGRIPYRHGAALPAVSHNGFASSGQPVLARGPEEFSAEQRCLSGAAQLPLLAPQQDQSLGERTVQIVQTEDYLVLSQAATAMHRIIKLAGAPLPYASPSWMGDSLASWDGGSLVINTTGFRREQGSALLPASAGLQIYERLQPVSENEILYTYTVWDPESYHEPFTVEMPLQRQSQEALPGAVECHEHNSTLPAALISARHREVATERAR